MLNRGHYPYKWLWDYAGDKFLKPKAHKNFHRCRPTTYYYYDIQNKVGKSLNNPEVKDLVGTRSKKQTKEILNSERKTRAQTVEAGMTLRTRKK